MAMSVVYTTLGGRVVYENRSGVERSYLRGPLGNTVGLMDMSGNVTDTYDYWPYGETRVHTGSSKTPLTFLGTLGYLTDFLNMLYVRARHLRVDLARWMTVDPLWPGQPAYEYAQSSPGSLADPSGLFLPIIPLICATACLLCAGCAIAVLVACNNWEAQGFGSFSDCAQTFINSLPWWQRDACLYVGLAGCVACIVVALWPVIVIVAPPLCYAGCLAFCEEILDLPTDQCLRFCSPILLLRL